MQVAPRKKDNARSRAERLFRERGGMLRMAEAVRAGVHRRTLYALRDAGVLEQLGRGLYRLADAPSLGNPDLVAVARRVPKGVVCLLSALAYHNLTTQIPHEVYLAVPRNAEPPRIDYPPVRVFRVGSRAFAEGIETHQLDGVKVRVYSREKTLADCFKYRTTVGLDTAVEALRRYRDQGRVNADALLRAARACRVENVMRPYLEATL
jgi:predicted transcriptional regulator of viral defense system